mmetsp:Transcript_112623/g.351109  ORF Transcript_112623/g.351109 Transcript_112623/m.351109 type:complete len:744 (+) Transcript_112623:109-2340(+)
MPFVRPHTSQELLAESAAAETADALEGGTDRVGAGLALANRHPQMPRADLVMVFPYKVDALVRWGEAQLEEETRGLRPPTDAERHKMEIWQARRGRTVHALSDSGLILMPYYSRDRDEIFVRIAADEQHLRQVAEMRQYKLELKPQYLSAFAPYKNDYAGRRDLDYSDRCVVSHIYKNHVDKTDDDGGSAYPQPGAIFRTTDRIQLIDYIVREQDHNCAGTDIGQLLHDSELLHYFPLHEHRKLVDLDKDWFKAFAWGTHIDKVRDYFGERIALYFLFMSHFNKWLTVPAIAGVFLWLLDLIMGTPDNPTAIFMCVGMGLWATFFIHFWRRLAAKHTLKWGTLGIGRQLEPTRPEFIGVSRINPVTGRVDRYYPWKERIWKVLQSYAVLTVTIIMLVFIVMVLFVMRHIFHRGPGRILFQFINSLVVEILNMIFTNIAKWLTERENHRAYSEYANHLLAKTVIFKFVNCYISLYYIAFFKENHYLFGQKMQCVNDDCLNDLGSQLAIFMIMRLTLQNFLELGMPYVLMSYRNYVEGRTFHTSMFTNPLTIMPDLSSAERQSKKEDYDLYEDMDELLILYGYTTLFVVACPWVPLLALVSSVLESFLDQKKLVLLFRRPFPAAAANNEPWDTAFDVFGMLAMVTNTAVVVFASHAYDDWSHGSKILLFLAIEHIMLFGRLAISVVAPAVPKSVKLLQMQQQVMVHRHLNLGGEEDDHETRANAVMMAHAPPPHVFDNDDEDEEW